MFKKFKAVALIVLTLLAACGGGGGGGGSGSGPATSTEIFQIRTAWINYIRNTDTYMGEISGTYFSYPLTGSVTLNQQPLRGGVFEGQIAQRKDTAFTGTFVANGVTRPYASVTTRFFDSDYLPLGETGGSDYEVVSEAVILPTTGRVGDSGNLYLFRHYSASSGAPLDVTTRVSYALEADTAQNTVLKIIETERDASGRTISVSTVILQIRSNGDIIRKQESYSATDVFFMITY